MKGMLAAALTAALTLMLAWTQAGWAQAYDPNTGDPPPGQHTQVTYNKWKLQATPDGGKLQGTVRLDCYSDEYDQVFLKVKGLQPHAKYTVWLVNTEKGEAIERAGVARHWTGDEASEFFFVSEEDGQGFYNGWLTRCPLGKWKYLEVRYHPNGNVKDLDRSVVVAHARMLGR
jgi:hypothetical protein